MTPNDYNEILAGIQRVHAANAERMVADPDGDSTICERCSRPCSSNDACPAVPRNQRWRVGVEDDDLTVTDFLMILLWGLGVSLVVSGFYKAFSSIPELPPGLPEVAAGVVVLAIGIGVAIWRRAA